MNDIREPTFHTVFVRGEPCRQNDERIRCIERSINALLRANQRRSVKGTPKESLLVEFATRLGVVPRLYNRIKRSRQFRVQVLKLRDSRVAIRVIQIPTNW